MGLPQETIIDIEDREFAASLGNWTGDAVWEPNPIPTPYGYAVFHMEIGDTSKETNLTYPNVKIKPGQTHRFILQILTNDPAFDMTISAEITDGVYTFSGSQVVTPPPYFTYLDFSFDAPLDFNQAASEITVRVEQDVQTEEGIMYTTFYTCTWESEKVDHLSLMGVH